MWANVVSEHHPVRDVDNIFKKSVPKNIRAIYYRLLSEFSVVFLFIFLLKTFILVCENSCYKNKKFRALLKALKALKLVIRSKKFSLYDCLAVTLNTNYYKKPVYKKPRALKYSNEA